MINCLLACALNISLGIATPVYDTDEVRVENDVNFNARIGLTDDVYVWGSYEDGTTINMVGQRFATLDQIGFGVGFRPHVTERLYLLGEAGYFLNDLSFRKPGNILIRDEAVWTRLFNVHARKGQRPLWRPDHTTYDLGNGVGGRVGLGYEFHKNAAVELKYTFRSFAEDIDACQGPDAACKFPVAPPFKHWQERQNRNMNAWEVGLQVRF